MNPRSRAFARVLAFLALAAGMIAIVYVVSASIGDEGGDREPNRVGRERDRPRQPQRDEEPGRQRAFYVVQSGDTLTAIAARTGVGVAELQELNPGIDPQILVSGQRLRLR